MTILIFILAPLITAFTIALIVKYIQEKEYLEREDLTEDKRLLSEEIKRVSNEYATLHESGTSQSNTNTSSSTPFGTGTPLSEEQRKLIEHWIYNGYFGLYHFVFKEILNRNTYNSKQKEILTDCRNLFISMNYQDNLDYGIQR
jgi:hypothetical protein